MIIDSVCSWGAAAAAGLADEQHAGAAAAATAVAALAQRLDAAHAVASAAAARQVADLYTRQLTLLKSMCRLGHGWPMEPACCGPAVRVHHLCVVLGRLTR